MEQSPVTLSIKGTADQVAIVCGWGMLRAFAEAADMVDRPARLGGNVMPMVRPSRGCNNERPSPQKEEPP